MQNYPGVWSLLSIQFTPDEIDPLSIPSVQPLFERMSAERLGGAPIRLLRYLTSGSCAKNPMNRRVVLHLYEVEIDDPIALNPRFYSDDAWLTPDEYEERARGKTCGLCMRLWSDYAVKHGLADRRFAPALESADG